MRTYPTCIFCNRNDSKPSLEHVLPTWIAEEFPAAYWEIENFYTDRTFKAYNNLGLKKRKPCVRCNNTWMSQLEVAAKPTLSRLIHGKRTTLTPDDQLLIIRWFTKTAIMFDLVPEKKREPYFNQDECQALMQSLAFPPNTNFFLAQYHGTRDATTTDAHLPLTVARRPYTDPSSVVFVKGYTATFSIKHLVLQVFSLRHPKEYPSEPVTLSVEACEGAVIDIWPMSGTVDWPPPLTLDDDGFKFFADRWERLKPI